jgi:hypothetical protein
MLTRLTKVLIMFPSADNCWENQKLSYVLITGEAICQKKEEVMINSTGFHFERRYSQLLQSMQHRRLLGQTKGNKNSLDNRLDEVLWPQ